MSSHNCCVMIFLVMAQSGGFDPELFFAALADRTRLRLLNLMRDGEVCVCFFADTLRTNDPKISRHLAYLKRAGLVYWAAARAIRSWSSALVIALRRSRSTLAIRNVVVAWEQPSVPSGRFRKPVLGCLRAVALAGGTPVPRRSTPQPKPRKWECRS